MENAIAPMLLRMRNAEDRLVSCLMTAGEISETDARKVARAYRQFHAVKYGANDGQFRLKDGRMMDRDQIQYVLATHCAGIV